MTFEEGKERNTALGILGGIAGSGAAIGVLLGGILTEFAGWQWVFFVNVPIGVLALFFVRRFVRESRSEGIARSFDAGGAFAVTSSLMVLVYALTQASQKGWGSTQTIGLLLVSAALMVAFLLIESRVSHPLVRLGFFRQRTPTGANIIALGIGTMVVGMFFLLSLYMQQVLGFSALQTGLAYLAVSLTAIVGLRHLAGARHQARRQADPLDRDDRAHDRAPPLRPDLGPRLVRLGPLPRLHHPRHRPRLLVRAGLDRGARRRSAERRGARIGPHQHEPADRRRARRRDPDDRRRQPRQPRARRRRLEGRREHGRLPARLLRRGRVRRRQPHRNPADPAPARARALARRRRACRRRPDRREIHREHRAARDPRRDPATVGLPRRRRCRRATATAPGAAVGAAAARRGDRDRRRHWAASRPPRSRSTGSSLATSSSTSTAACT